MAYLRFLTNSDYNCIATEEQMGQIIRGIPERIPQAEQRAEMQMLEYLDQYYEIEKELAKGKNIREYNVNVTYPGGVFIKYNDNIYKTLTGINGIKRPSKTEYWSQIVDFIDPLRLDKCKKYSQLRMYSKGEVVMFGTEYWECVTPHGFDAGEVHMPGAQAWKEVEVTPWEPNLEWEKDQVCSYEGKFYQYLSSAEEVVEEVQAGSENMDGENTPQEEENTVDNMVGSGEASSSQSEGDNSAVEEGGASISDEVLNPEEDDNWGLIGGYSEELEYDYSEGARDYVVADGAVFYPIMNPNPDKPEVEINITLEDPRNQNIVAHLSRIALYHLHSIIAPTNVPETRRIAYEDSVTWLYNASKFRINPQIPRKRDREGGLPKVDWACATFQRDYNPNENAWLI